QCRARSSQSHRFRQSQKRAPMCALASWALNSNWLGRLEDVPMTLPLLDPASGTLVLVDPQAGLAFGVGSEDRQTLRNNLVAPARPAKVFGLPIIVSTSATKVYSGPVMPAVQQAILDVKAIDRRPLNAWEDPAVRAAITGAGRKRLLIAGLLTEACVSFTALS